MKWNKVTQGTVRVKIGKYWLFFKSGECFPSTLKYRPTKKRYSLGRGKDVIEVKNISPKGSDVLKFSEKLVAHLQDIESKDRETLVDETYKEMIELELFPSRQKIGEKFGRTREWAYRGIGCPE